MSKRVEFLARGWRETRGGKLILFIYYYFCLVMNV